jgi:hypothetical protein
MPKKIDLTGKRFGRWTVIAYAGRSRWSCECDCGARVIVDGASLRRGRTKSCGCLRNCLRNMPRIDLTGKRFGRWTVVAYMGDGKWSCVCDCDCDARVVVRGHDLRTGHSRSCGCLKRELISARLTKHGLSRTPEYNSWQAMMARCFDPRNPSYEYYGGRGIRPCEEWCSILGFFADTAPRPPGCSLDRKDVNRNYGPDNWCWATAKQQANNRRPRRARTVKRRKVKPPPPLDDPPF